MPPNTRLRCGSLLLNRETLISCWAYQKDEVRPQLATRAFIEAFFFRVKPMLSGGTVALNMEQPLLPPAVKSSISTTLHGIVDHTATIVDGSAEGKFVNR